MLSHLAVDGTHAYADGMAWGINVVPEEPHEALSCWARLRRAARRGLGRGGAGARVLSENAPLATLSCAGVALSDLVY